MAYQVASPPITVWRTRTHADGLSGVCPVSGQSVKEEMVNSLTHAVGLALSIGGAIVLLALAGIYGDRWHLIGCSVYGATLVMAYAASTLYHASGSSLHKKFLQQVDQSFIYLLIAGTYTPFTLVPLNGGWGWSLLAIVWSVALAGIGVKVLFADRFQRASVPVCLCLGWLCVIAGKSPFGWGHVVTSGWRRLHPWCRVSQMETITL